MINESICDQQCIATILMKLRDLISAHETLKNRLSNTVTYYAYEDYDHEKKRKSEEQTIPYKLIGHIIKRKYLSFKPISPPYCRASRAEFHHQSPNSAFPTPRYRSFMLIFRKVPIVKSSASAMLTILPPSGSLRSRNEVL